MLPGGAVVLGDAQGGRGIWAGSWSVRGEAGIRLEYRRRVLIVARPVARAGFRAVIKISVGSGQDAPVGYRLSPVPQESASRSRARLQPPWTFGILV